MIALWEHIEGLQERRVPVTTRRNTEPLHKKVPVETVGLSIHDVGPATFIGDSEQFGEKALPVADILTAQGS
jgi:hypothetical protein